MPELTPEEILRRVSLPVGVQRVYPFLENCHDANSDLARGIRSLKCELFQCSKGEEVIKEDSAEGKIVVIVTGLAKQSRERTKLTQRKVPNKEEYVEVNATVIEDVLDFQGPGSIIGFGGALDHFPHRYSLKAVEEGYYLMLEPEQFREVVMQNPVLLFNFLVHLHAELDNDCIFRGLFTADNPRKRIGSVLLQIARAVDYSVVDIQEQITDSNTRQFPRKIHLKKRWSSSAPLGREQYFEYTAGLSNPRHLDWLSRHHLANLAHTTFKEVSPALKYYAADQSVQQSEENKKIAIKVHSVSDKRGEVEIIEICDLELLENLVRASPTRN